MKTYEEKIVFLYSLIMKSQELYFDYTNNELILPDMLKKLIKKCKESKIENDSDFIDFINENLVIPSKSGHLYLSPIEFVSNQISSPAPKEKQFSYQIINDDTLHIVFKTFSRKYLQEAVAMFDEIKGVLSNNNIENVIFDIRGNSGGSDEYFKFFDLFSNENIDYEEHYVDLFNDVEYRYKRKVIRKGTEINYNKFLLVDGSVFSTSDALTKICKNTGFATVIGAKTHGEGFWMFSCYNSANDR